MAVSRERFSWWIGWSGRAFPGRHRQVARPPQAAPRRGWRVQARWRERRTGLSMSWARWRPAPELDHRSDPVRHGGAGAGLDGSLPARSAQPGGGADTGFLQSLLGLLRCQLFAAARLAGQKLSFTSTCSATRRGGEACAVAARFGSGWSGAALWRRSSTTTLPGWQPRLIGLPVVRGEIIRTAYGMDFFTMLFGTPLSVRFARTQRCAARINPTEATSNP